MSTIHPIDEGYFMEFRNEECCQLIENNELYLK